MTQPATRDVADLVWNGNVGGKRAPSGQYRWALTVASGGTTTTVGTGTLSVGCGGSPSFHSYTCNGLPTLLGITNAATGAGTWLTAQTGKTGLTAAGSESLGAATAIVPFGDVTADYRNDLLVRRSDGSLRAYFNDGTLNFAGNRTVLIPGNFNRYNALVHVGDITGDGRSDLLARETTTGRLFRYNGNGNGGLASPAAYGGTYKTITRFVGPGDINGDGKADLLVFYGGTMYAWYGNGQGGFATSTPHYLGNNYANLTVIGAGDLNEDGKNDLILRNTAGVLGRKLGNGNGTFADYQTIGTGYQKYAGLY
ncbi:FG-GAP repeat domain-containing protein [Paractinoplanes deccanensis]|uniref:FG-GAP repeat domain-containing protein n=1 Tax=Paractinoplanes deccanensis TaxID=113561 RepID=UPI0019443BA5|nr:VCBS repeat-containing protein [Actinoplanes deccanensis]